MTIQVNIGAAKTRLSELVAASERGEEVVLARAGKPVVRLVPDAQNAAADAEARAARRIAAIGFAKAEFAGAKDIGPSMTDAELEERFQRKFGPAD